MPRSKVLITTTPAETKLLGRSFGKKMKRGAVLALVGQLGSGKTTFVKGIALGLGLRRKISSPTFLTMICRPIPKTSRMFCHLDLYRHHGPRTVQELGLPEIFKNKQYLIVIEWPEKIKTLLPPHTKWIHFFHDRRNPKTRIIKIL